ncbi:MAG: hypothetical protein EXR67_00765 [Dehalococcoidia bacterium]|nr:hypothetical protein [Dehalococcoidia bacterium]
MSKFVQALERLNKEGGGGTSLGFGFTRVAGKAAKPSVMMLLAVSSQSEQAAAASKLADGFLLRPAGRSHSEAAAAKAFGENEQTPWGIQISKLNPEQAAALKKQGCDFLALSSNAVTLDALKDNDLGRLLLVSANSDKEQAHVFAAMPVDAVVIPEPLTSPLTLQQLLELATFRSWSTKPVLASLTNTPTQWELECLRDIGLSGIALVIDQAGMEGLESLSKAIKELGPRKPPKVERSMALVPAPATAPAGRPGREPEKPDEDDDDD